MEAIQVLKGMRDLLPEQTAWWQRMERELAGVLDRFGYQELRTPLLEPTALFKRSIGEATDIVEKEMYTFQDLDGSSVTLRPEGTASAVRAYLENFTWKKEPISRWYYLGTMFRHEKPQKGRYRMFSQVGAELLGAAEPAADVELIDLAVECVRAVGLSEATLELNSLGCPACRPAYRERLVAYLRVQRSALCEPCQRRLETNPLRVLDCKVEGCQKVAEEAPRILDFLGPECLSHLEAVRAGLESMGHAYRLNHRMVRGLDYYSRTTFELLTGGLGAQSAVAGGGRYDGLVAQLGGPEIPAVGFAAGLDRILLRLAELREPPQGPPIIFVASQGEAGWRAALPLVQRLRRAGHKVLSDVRAGSLKAQLKRADKDRARLVLVLGEEEIQAGAVSVKDMAAPEGAQDKQVRCALADLDRLLGEKLGGVK
ncbi:MAG TPA: histidine--tRNA ligase [Myxococcota bacterium]|nr:histidine--tRNA ligase [Myxococcota bacterium]HRY92500.1 histidine--tRNA ligase [Myxococcota bacterium]HSA24144.1 histidine--tRNA ligase [Myxococcota bacterium]